MENTRCPKCGVKARKELTNRALLDNIPIEELAEHPHCLDTIWTGRLICPKCKQVVPAHKEER